MLPAMAESFAAAAPRLPLSSSKRLCAANKKGLPRSIAAFTPFGKKKARQRLPHRFFQHYSRFGNREWRRDSPRLRDYRIKSAPGGRSWSLFTSAAGQRDWRRRPRRQLRGDQEIASGKRRQG